MNEEVALSIVKDNPDIITENDLLRQKSGHCFSTEIAEQLINALRKKTESFPEGRCLGLAAVQLGVPLRVGYLNIKGEEIILVNPEFVGQHGERIAPEGCMSFPGKFIETVRFSRVLIKDDSTEEVREFSGLKAQAVQHEIAHMNGELFYDYEKKAEKKAEKVGRNSPCNCGSGKKYKKCCGRPQ
jgi:peptide deformylase